MAGTLVFNLSPKDFASLGQDRAVEALRRLLWAEAGKVGVGANLINVPQCINVGDGGIDAYIDEANPTKDEIIPVGCSGFQVKSSDLSPAKCKAELHIDEDLRKALKPEVEQLLKKKGTYVLVLFADITSAKLKTRESAIKEELARAKHRKVKIRVYTANHLAGFFERFPSLVAWLRNDRTYCLPYAFWSQRRDITVPRRFIADNGRERLANEIRDKLRAPGGSCVVYRITGLAGIGKTRFVHEALSPQDLNERVIYVTADSFRLSPLYQTLQIDDTLSSIIVVDECTLQQHEELVRSFSTQGDRVALITLSHELGNLPSPSLSLVVGRLAEDKLRQIIQAENPGLPRNVADRLSRFADGYPRIGVLLAESYLSRGKDNKEYMAHVDDDSLIDRLIGGSDTKSDHYRKTRRVLRELSIFSKVGYEGELSEEAKWIAKRASIDFMDFQEVIAEQRKRGIIQGDHYIYVTPFMLRVYLSKEWWDTYGFTKEGFEDFVKHIPENFRTDLLQRFFDQVPYIASSEKGKDFAATILGREGPFADGKFLKTKLGGDFFLRLTEADPASALLCLEKTVGVWSKAELRNFLDGRREVVWALERVAVWRPLFAGAAKLLLALADAENETYANNASGVFVNLFSLGPGVVAPTEAPPEERFPILIEALDSPLDNIRNLAIRAVDRALDTGPFHRDNGPENQGLKRLPGLWKPKSLDEVAENYLFVWKLAINKVGVLPESEKIQVVHILLKHIRGLSQLQTLNAALIPDVRRIVELNPGRKKEAIKHIEEILFFENRNLPSDVINNWENLKKELIGGDFSSLLRRYAGMELIGDSHDRDGKRNEGTDKNLRSLAVQSLKDPQLLAPELRWLQTNQADNGYRFGYILGKEDLQDVLLGVLLETQRELSDSKVASDFFLGGYFKALFEKDTEKWETVLDELCQDPILSGWVPMLTWRSGMSNRAAERILNLALEGVINASHLRVFGYGSVIRDLSEEVFLRWIDFLLKSPEDYAISIALDLYQFFYFRNDPPHKFPEEYTYQLLTHPALFRKPASGDRDQMEDYNWTAIAKGFVKTFPDRTLPLAELILGAFGSEGTMFEYSHSESRQIIDGIAEKHPAEVWDIVTKYIGPPIDSRAYEITDWLKGSDTEFGEGGGALSFFAPEFVWKWVDADPSVRANYLASFAPKGLHRQEGTVCWAREIIVRYGDQGGVRSYLSSNFFTEGWVGPESAHYRRKKDYLLRFENEETDKNVIRWIQEMVGSLDERIMHAETREERRGY